MSQINSFFPAAKRVLHDPVVKWIAGGIATCLSAFLYLYILPEIKSWITSRADTETVTDINSRVVTIEGIHKVNYDRLALARPDDTGAMTHSERVEWLIIRVKRLQMQAVLESRKRVALEAKLRMPNPKSDAAKQTAKAVQLKYDEFIKEQQEPAEAAANALDAVFGSE